MPVLLSSAKILAPVVLLLAAGYAIGTGRVSRDGKPPALRWLSWLALYLLAPCQVFSGLYHAPVNLREALSLFLVITGFLAATGLLASLAAWLAAVPERLRYPFLLTVLFGNSGYYGIPVCFLAFGREGFNRAAIYMICTSILSNTIGLYLAARGHGSPREAIVATARSPILWGLVLAVAARASGVTRPEWLFELVDLLSTAAIPLVLLLLGAQLAQLQVARDLKPLMLSAVFRLAIAPAVAAWAVGLAGITGITRQVVLVEAAMPTAIVVGLFALHFDNEPQFAAGSVLFSTMLSPLTLLVVLMLVGR